MIFAVRHAERADRTPEPPPIDIAFDPHITERGILQARRAGKKIAQTIEAHVEVDEIVIYSSPFLRCLMTAASIRQEIAERHPDKPSKILLNNMLTESLITKYYDKDPHDDLYVKTKSPDEVQLMLSQQDHCWKQEKELGHPHFPQLKHQAYTRIEIGYSKILDKHFGEEKEKTPAVVCVTHAFGIIGFANHFKDKDYDGRWDYACISACRVFKNKESEVVLSSHSKHVEDLLVEYNLHLKKEEKKEEKKEPEENKENK